MKTAGLASGFPVLQHTPVRTWDSESELLGLGASDTSAGRGRTPAGHCPQEPVVLCRTSGQPRFL